LRMLRREKISFMMLSLPSVENIVSDAAR